MRTTSPRTSARRALVVALGGMTLFVAVGVVSAAPTIPPDNTAEPRITGNPRVGQVQRADRGTWTGTPPLTYEYRWFRCDGAGAPDASDCTRISNAPDNTYVAREADAGFRLRVRVIARNGDGQDTATSNPTPVITSAKPTNTTEPSISGSAVVGSRLDANRGQWAGEQPITYAYVWLRCSANGDNCSEISGETDTSYKVRTGDVGRTIRVRVRARNDRGATSAVSNPTAVVTSTQPPPPPGNSIPVDSLQPAGDRLSIGSVQFTPSPVTSRTAPITIRVRVTARGGTPVRGALVFVRGTPRVVEGQTQATEADGRATLTLIPNDNFPQPRSGFNVQFFVKAYRPGTPALDDYSLVQVRLAG